MTAERDQERDLLAAEYVLGLLDAGEMRAASERLRAEPGFAAAVAGWEARLAALAEAAQAKAPGAELRARILATALAANDDGAPGSLARSRNRWRSLAGGMGVLVAALAVVLGVQAQWGGTAETPVATGPALAPVLVASLAAPDSDTSLAIAYDSGRRRLTVSPGQLRGAAGHDHELWIIPEGGVPVSLGLVRADAPARIDVPAAVAPHFRRQATIALSVEPAGGSPTGQPTGAVVASGTLGEI